MMLAILVLLALAILTRARSLVQVALCALDAAAAAARRFAADPHTRDLEAASAQAVAQALQEAQHERDGRIRAENELRAAMQQAEHARHEFEQAMRLHEQRDERERRAAEADKAEQAQTDFEQRQAQQLFDARRRVGQEPN